MTTHEEVAAAIRRFADAKIESTAIEVRADTTRGRRALFIGICLMVALLFVARWVDSIGGEVFLARTVVTGLQIGAWVALWFPIEKLFWSAWSHRSDRVVYERLRDVHFKLVVPPAAT